MEFDFYYADLCVGVTFKAGLPTSFAGLTDDELSVLQQIVYLALNSFLLTRTMYLKELAEIEKRIDKIEKDDIAKEQGG